MTDRVGTAGPGCPAANHIKMAALRYPFANHVGTAALGCRADGTRVPHLARRVEATAQKTPIGAASGKGATSQAAERLPFGAVSRSEERRVGKESRSRVERVHLRI